MKTTKNEIHFIEHKNGQELYESGIVAMNKPEPDYVEAASYFEKASEYQHMDAANDLGSLYQRGLGVPQNFIMCIKLYRLAAERGHVIAQYNLGTRYRTGQGTPVDFKEAAKWIESSAKQGYLDAINDLGTLYRYGQGVKKNLFTAIQYYGIAASNGDELARTNLRELEMELAATQHTD